MTADDARKLTDRATPPAPPSAVTLAVTFVEVQIERAARKGERSVVEPLADYRGVATHEQRTLAYAQLDRAGFRVDHHHNLVTDNRWVTISW